VLLRFGLVKRRGLALLDGNGALGAMAQAGTQTVTVDLAHQSRLPVNDGDGPLGTAGHTFTATVALPLVDLDHLA
jgi:hypothetical protein